MSNCCVSYIKLWNALKEKGLSKADLRKGADISPNTMTKLTNNKIVSLTILIKICEYLNCNIGDICDIKITRSSESLFWK